MRRLLTGPFLYLADLFRTVGAAWDRFVFRPADPTPLALVRVASGLLAFWSLFVVGLDLHAYLGSTGWANPAAVAHFRGLTNPTAWSAWTFVPDGLLRVAWVGALVVLGLLTVGLFSRVTAVLAWVIVVSTSRRVPVMLYGFDQILSTLLFYLAVSGASGQAVSLDRFLARFRKFRLEMRAHRSRPSGWVPESGVPGPTVSANIGLRLIQCHLVLIYASAALAKFQGQSWWVGDAFWRTIAAGEFRLFDLTWLASYPRFLEFCTHAALALELLYPILVWVRPVRPLAMAAVAAMHAGIGLTLGLTEFSLAMIAGNLAFVSGPWARSLVSGRPPGVPSGRVLYDGACPRCRASMALFSAADPDRVFEPIDLTAVDPATIHPGLTKADCLKAMHLVRADGRVESGYDAVLTILGWLPPTWPASLLRYVPGVSPIGRRVYNRIADARPRDQACTDETCGLHPAAAERTVRR